MADERERLRGEVALPPNEFLFALEETKGVVNTYVGSCKASLTNTEQAVTFDHGSKRFVPTPLERARQLFATAPEGWYIVMKNPAKEDKHVHPSLGMPSQTMPSDLLDVGKKVNIPGPCSFPLWPGQMVKVVAGHRLRSNQYLVVRVYDASAAEKSFHPSIFGLEKKELKESVESVVQFATGQLLVVKGTKVSFFIPPTGFEVVPEKKDDKGKDVFVRDAVSLEQLEYCILLDESGEKTYKYGDKKEVVFPEPTQTFIPGKDGSVKFRAYELNEISGLYIKVIAPYEEGEGNTKISYSAGTELFITGKQSMIYYPRPEHGIVTYDGKDKHNAVAIPEGEGRYALNRQTGKIVIIKGSAMFLPDPRVEVIVRRVLDDRTVELYYPGNTEALEYNKKLRSLTTGKADNFVTDEIVSSTLGRKNLGGAEKTRASASFVADDFQRGTEYTPPRTITLNTKFEGVPRVDVWTGYSVQVVSGSGKRRVVTGPERILLEYDETLEAMELSTGTPKRDDATLKTVYLKVLGNKVSDQVIAETRDFCQVSIKLSYRVNFEGDKNKWFNVENYVKFLTQHARSLIRNAIKKHGIEGFYQDSISIIRDTILGQPGEDKKRPGRSFEENGMRIYDVEVLDVQIGDPTIAGLLKNAQQTVVKETFEMAIKRRMLEQTKETETIERQITDEKTKTFIAKIVAEQSKIENQLELDQAKVASELQLLQEKLAKKLALEEGENKLHAEQLERLRKTKNQESEFSQKELELRIQELKAESEAITIKMKAITPNLIQALQAIGDKELIARVAESMAPLAILEGNSVADALNKLTRGTTVETLLGQFLNGKTNGEIKSLTE